MTGGCLIPFSTPLPLLPRFIPSATLWAYADPILTITLTFAEDMDQTVAPDTTDFVLTVDDVVKTLATSIWQDARNIELEYSEATLAPTVVDLRYSAKSINFLSVLDELVTPFDLEITAP